VDGSGLSSLSLTATHASSNFGSNAWASTPGTLTGQVTFDLHGAYMLVGMSVWNYSGTPGAGVQGVTVSTSTDGVTYTSLAGGPTTFAEGQGQGVATEKRTAAHLRVGDGRLRPLHHH
jgi:hypothetical protein